MNIRYSRRALAQLNEIFAFISADDHRRAVLFGKRIESLLTLLSRHPSIGRPTDLPNVRVFRAAPYPYLVFYKVDPPNDTITVLRLRHTARKEKWREGR